MRLASLLAVALVLTTVGTAFPQNQDFVKEPIVDAERGTLGIVIMTPSGIVIAADSRSTRGDGSFSDTADKIFQLGKYTACTIAGTVSFPNDFFGAVRSFDLPRTLQQYYASHPDRPFRPLKDEAFWLSLRITSALSNALTLKTSPFVADGVFLGTMIIVDYSSWTSPASKTVVKTTEAYKLKFEVAVQIGPTEHPRLVASDPTVTKAYWGPEPEPPFGMFTNGNAQVVWAILSGDPRFEESRKIPAIKKLIELDKQQKLSSMTLADARAVAESLISESIRLKGNELGIGGQIDIATITPDAGFQWAPGHDPAQKRQQPTVQAH